MKDRFRKAGLTALLLAISCAGYSGCSPAPAPRDTEQTAESRGAIRIFDILNIDVRDLPMMMAVEELEAKGYEVTKTYMSSTALIADALVRGDADVGIGNNQTFWKAIAKGAPVRTVAEFANSTHVVATTTGVTSCRELEGKQFGVPSTRGAPMLLLELYLKRACPGITPRYHVIVQSAGRAAALLAGECEAVMLPGEELIKLQLDSPGKFKPLMFVAKEFPSVHMDGLHIRREWASENPEAVKDFLTTLLRAQRKLMADPQLLIEEAVRRLELSPEAAKAIGEFHLGLNIWDGKGGLTKKGVQETIDFLRGAAALPEELEAGDVADLSFLDVALKDLESE